MKSSAKKIELASVDDLFSTEESRQDEQLEKIQEIPLSELHPFKDHPFKVKDDDAMIETADSIKKYGVLVPAIARPLPDGGYELVAGHRRRRASELAGKETMPVIVRDLDDDAATIIMVDSNLQRENLLPSERAFAYKMKLEAIKHQGARTDLTSVQVEQKLSARDQVAKEAGERSGIQVMRYVRLTELIPELLDSQLSALGLDSDAVFHRSKLILKIYRDVVWVLSERVEELQEYAWDLGKQDIDTGLCYLENFAPDIDLQDFEEKVCCVVESRMFVEIIDRALLRLRKYPDRGELYYEILTKQFIYRFNSTEKEMLEELNMERSVFYDRKKEAIYIFSVCLFGYAIPEVSEKLPRLISD